VGDKDPTPEKPKRTTSSGKRKVVSDAAASSPVATTPLQAKRPRSVVESSPSSSTGAKKYMIKELSNEDKHKQNDNKDEDKNERVTGKKSRAMSAVDRVFEGHHSLVDSNVQIKYSNIAIHETICTCIREQNICTCSLKSADKSLCTMYCNTKQ
jgi:hypothetical protein